MQVTTQFSQTTGRFQYWLSFKKFWKVFWQLNSFVNVNNIIYQNQFVFRSRHSAYMPAAILHDFLTSNLADRNKTASIYLNVARAFDTVNVEILPKKLWNYGITGTAHSLLKSYLSQRTHRLNIMILYLKKNIFLWCPARFQTGTIIVYFIYQ